MDGREAFGWEEGLALQWGAGGSWVLGRFGRRESAGCPESTLAGKSWECWRDKGGHGGDLAQGGTRATQTKVPS